MPVRFERGPFALQEAPFHFPRDDGDARWPLTGMGADLAWELRRVGWDVPGLDLTFRTSGEGDDVFRTLSEVSGHVEDGPFLLRYSLPQGSVGRYNVLTGLGDATVPPGLDVTYHSDHSGPSVKLYVGGDWKADGDVFARTSHTNSKLNGEPKTYLLYRAKGGALGTMHHDNDIGREYEPEGGEPRTLSGAEVAATVARTVQELVARLGAMPSAPGWDDPHPLGDANLRRLAAVERIPAPADMAPLHAWIDENQAYRGSRDDEGEARPFTLAVGGPGLHRYDDDLPEDARGYFTYAGHDPAVRACAVSASIRDNSVPAIVELKALNGVYVLDNGAFDKAQEESFARAEAEGRDRITNAELNASYRAAAMTLVPYADYAGGYAVPTVVIGRNLGPDEARLARGTVSVAVDEEADAVRATLVDEATGASFVLLEDRAIRGGIRRAIQAAQRACDVTGSVIEGPLPEIEPEPRRDLSFLFR